GPGRAGALFELAGWLPAARRPLELVYDAGSAELASAAEVVASAWRDVGVTALLQPLAPVELAERLQRSEFDAALLAEPVLTDPDLSRRYHTDALGLGNV